MNTLTITIPKSATRSRQGELVAIPRKELDALIAQANAGVGEKDVLRWSREARAFKRMGKLPML